MTAHLTKALTQNVNLRNILDLTFNFKTLVLSKQSTVFNTIRTKYLIRKALLDLIQGSRFYENLRFMPTVCYSYACTCALVKQYQDKCDLSIIHQLCIVETKLLDSCFFLLCHCQLINYTR